MHLRCTWYEIRNNYEIFIIFIAYSMLKSNKLDWNIYFLWLMKRHNLINAIFDAIKFIEVDIRNEDIK